jgi:TM2 domain-containing membrane protein YozV
LEPQLTKVFDYFDGTFSLVIEEMVESMQQDLRTLQELLSQAERYYPTTLNWSFWVSVGCNMALALVCVLIFMAVMRLYFGYPVQQWLKTTRSFVLIPIFLFLIVMGWVFSTVFIAASIGMADVCIDSPDKVMLAVLRRIRDDFRPNSVVYDFLQYYVRGCPVSSAPQDIDQRYVFFVAWLRT